MGTEVWGYFEIGIYAPLPFRLLPVLVGEIGFEPIISSLIEEVTISLPPDFDANAEHVASTGLGI